jgi:hypothetical protein
MKKKNLLIALLMMICIRNLTFAQITFQKTFGGTGSETGIAVQQTTDGGYIMAGSTTSFGAGLSDVYLIRTTANGDTLWTKTFGGTNNDYGYDFQQTADGGFIIAGSTSSFGAGTGDVYLVRTAANGNTLWTKTFGGTGSDVAYSIQQTSDSGYIITGSTQSFGAGVQDVYLIKTTATGDTLWTKTFGGTGIDVGRSAQQTTDGGFILAGYTKSFGSGVQDIYLIRTTANGDTLWTRTYGGTDTEFCGSLQKTSDGGYIIAGYTYSFGEGSGDVYLIKTTTNGDTLWTKTYGGTSNDNGRYAQQTADGGYIISGTTESFGAGDIDFYLIKTNANGDTLWTKTYGGTSTDIGIYARQTSDGGYIFTGKTVSFSAGTLYLIKTDASGNSGCHQLNTLTITNTPATQQTTTATIVTTPATICTTPATIMRSGSTISTLCQTSGISELLPDAENITVYPNPVQENVNILLQQNSKAASIRIYNIYGSLVRESLINNGVTIISVSELTDGLYLYQVTDSSNKIIDTGKIVKEK